MASKTIMIQEDTYDRLLRLKNPNESFNDCILRLIKTQQNLEPYFGILTEEEGDAIENAIDEGRQQLDRHDKIRKVEI